MKQIIQNLKTGETILEDIPIPKIKPGHILVQTKASLVSLGTEKMLVEFGQANLIAKARQQPEKVAMVLDKIKADGLIPTIEAVFKKLEEPLPLGYCNAGVVVDVGEGVTNFKIGDRVASNGQHAEFVLIPANLAAHIPDSVSFEEASFTVISSIGLQGIRLLNPTFGETIVVYGLGLIGLITAQILNANGCKVVGLDVDDTKIDLARSLGIEAVNIAKETHPVKYVQAVTNNVGADGVIITASSKTDEIISNSAQMCRKRGRIVLVGVVGLKLNRSEFYEKELSFQVSCSYGPGRYDDNYELKGIDYPLPYVRWTENRNFQAILSAIAEKRIRVTPLITEKLKLEDFSKVYGSLNKSKAIATIFTYSDKAYDSHDPAKIKTNDFKPSRGSIGIIGAGNFTKMTMLPILNKANAPIKYIASSKGISATFLAKKYNIGFSTRDYQEILSDPDVDTVIITTRHDQHAPMVIEALENDKNVFVEKPLALNREELDKIIEIYKKKDKALMVGFNRRFSPYTIKMKSLIGNSNDPINIIANMNAGFIPANVWVHDLKVGGGRIIGEACHFIDLISYLTGSEVTQVFMSGLGVRPEINTDNASIILKYKNGSQGVVNYFSNGSKAYSKERIEVYSQGRNLILDNFRELRGYGFKDFKVMKGKQDKGHKNQFEQLVQMVLNGGKALIDFNSIVNTTKASFAAIQSLQKGCWVNVE